MTKDEAMKLALEALEKDPAPLNAINNAKCFLYSALEQPDPFSRLVRIMGTFDLSTGHADNWNDLLDSLESELRDVLGHYREAFKVEQECNAHPDAPHGFNRESSHSLGRYVCDCEGWEPEQKPVAWWNPRYGKGEYAFAEEQSPPDDSNDPSDFGWNIPLYTTPPKREWVGLTGDEVNDLKHWLDHRAQWSYIEFARAIEAKLKEKNT